MKGLVPIKRFLIILIVVSLSVFSILLPACTSSVPDEIPEKMPDDFAVWFSYSIDPDRPNALDTYEGRIYKDLVMDGVAAADYTISKHDLKEIYRKLRECRIYEITEEMTSINLSKSGNIMTSPLVKYVIAFTIDDAEYTVTGDSTAFFYPRAKKFQKFCEYMTEFLRNTEEYQAFPKSRGGYD